MRSKIAFHPISRTDHRLGVFTKTISLSLGLAVGPGIASASDWAGGSGNWSSIISPGWTVGGVPNAVGAVANFGSSTSNGTTTQDIVAGVTVGTISYSITGNQSRTITLTNALTLNQDGAGSGTATISNSNATTTLTAGSLTLSAGTLTLADNLLITNTGSNANTTGAIRIQSTVGGTGNIELSNSGTSQNTTTGAGAIRLEGTNTFTGNVTVSKGLATFTNVSAFGGVAGNTLTLGSSGQNATLLLMSTSSATIANNWAVASGAGTAVLSSTATTQNVAQTYTGTGTLNSTLTLSSDNTGGGRVALSGTISGTGGITKTGVGLARLSNANTYSGDTLVSAGTLNLTNSLAIQNSAFDTSGAGTITLGVTATTFGGLKGSTALATAITTGYSSVTGLTLNVGTGANLSYGGAIADGAASMSLTKSGAGTQTFTGTNTYTGATNVSAGTLGIGGTGSINTSSGVNVAAGAKLAYNSSTALTVAPVLNGSGTSNRAVLSGSGPVNASLVLNNVGDTLSPGNSPGTATFQTGQSWESFSFDWEINNFTGTTAGTDFDQIGITGALALTGDSGNYILNVLSLTAGNVGGLVPNFSEISQSWTILSTTGGITGFDAANWTIDVSGFTNPETGTFSLGQTGNNLVLAYTTVPEPNASMLLGGLGMLCILRRRRA